jgi:alginate O-acetyltransferase complex protein AlgJ
MTTIGQSPLDREAIAQIEVGHTDVTPRTARLLAGVFLGLLAGVCAGGAAAGPWARLSDIPADARQRVNSIGASSTWHRIVAANRAVLQGIERFEDALEDESRVAGAIRPTAQLTLSAWLGAGNDRTFVGREGWLFYQPDVAHLTGSGFLDPAVQRRRRNSASEWAAMPATDPRPALLAFARELGAPGITLIVVPTPLKPALEPERLAVGASDEALPIENPSSRQFIEDLRSAGVLVFDPADVLVEAKRMTGTTQYLATDTHWRPEAMELVAERLVEFIRMHVQLPEERVSYRVAGAEIQNLGDLGAMLDLPVWQTRYRRETVSIRRVLQADGTPWRPSRNADVLVLGDSFSNIYSLASMGWGDSAGLVEHLSAALQRPVDRIVQNDAGAYATRELLRQAGDERLSGKRVVIYQFATRELSFGDWKVFE